MRNTFSLSIPKPCHERWETFTPTGKGSFCDSCQKEVIDFTQWSDEQIRQYISKNNQRTCGRFKAEQLKYYSPDSPYTLPRWLPAAVLAPALMMAVNTNAQTRDTTLLGAPVAQLPLNEKVEFHDDVVPPKDIVVRGTVHDTQDGTPIAGAAVIRKGTAHGTSTDANGNFSITLDNAEETLVIAFIGYATQEINVSAGNDIAVKLDQDTTTLMGELVIIKKRRLPGRIWWKIKNIF